MTLIHIYVLHNTVFLPQIVLDLEVMGEDETSFREHINAITLELRKSNPSYSEVKNRMKRTLFKRVQLMDRPAAEVMEQFPFLGVPQLVSKHCYILCQADKKNQCNYISVNFYSP